MSAKRLSSSVSRYRLSSSSAGIDGAAARLEDDPQILGAFVADVGQDRQFLVGDQGRDLLDQLALLDAIGDFADQQVPAAALFGDLLDPRPKPERAAAADIGAGDGVLVVDQHAAGREIGAAHMLEERAVVDPAVVDQRRCGIGQLAQIVRRDAGRHPDRDPAGAVGEQVGEQAGEDLGLVVLAIVGRAEADRALVEPGHELGRDRGQPGLGIAVGGGIIAVDVAEIALPVDERVAEREILREADHRVIDALVAVRVIFADDIADHPRRLLVRRGVALARGAGGIELEQAHRPQQPPVDRLHAVADVGQRARGDRRQRIDEIALRQSGVERGVDD